MMKLLLKNAKIYDGTGAEPYFSDILIDGEKIAHISPQITEEADRVLDLGNRSVSSGFIDAHSHNDWFALKKNQLPYFSPFIRQGI
ncbi:MAG: D-aminoacylase, partial [Clostridia bacterium]|nr:D-aminoacylase [Clostridia bacterium]MBR5382923.1 D-aminoacylase [Clostridia bacterium]